ncbi:MAG: hypothetical protein J6X38_06465 [Abditibacteriota bacterium]|nr:hypothetical protein [Abditibacteriota bacterium]
MKVTSKAIIALTAITMAFTATAVTARPGGGPGGFGGRGNGGHHGGNTPQVRNESRPAPNNNSSRPAPNYSRPESNRPAPNATRPDSANRPSVRPDSGNRPAPGGNRPDNNSNRPSVRPERRSGDNDSNRPSVRPDNRPDNGGNRPSVRPDNRPDNGNRPAPRDNNRPGYGNASGNNRPNPGYTPGRTDRPGDRTPNGNYGRTSRPADRVPGGPSYNSRPGGRIMNGNGGRIMGPGGPGAPGPGYGPKPGYMPKRPPIYDNRAPIYRDHRYYYGGGHHAYRYGWWNFRPHYGRNRRSAFFFYGALTYMLLDHVINRHYTYPTYVVTYDYGRDYYLEDAKVPSLARIAFDDIAAGWRSSRAQEVARYIKSDDIAVLLDGSFEYYVSAKDYENMLYDAMDSIDTIDFNWYAIRRASDSTYTAYGVHTYYDEEGYTKSVYASYRVKVSGGTARLIEVGSSESRL